MWFQSIHLALTLDGTVDASEHQGQINSHRANKQYIFTHIFYHIQAHKDRGGENIRWFCRLENPITPPLKILRHFDKIWTMFLF